MCQRVTCPQCGRPTWQGCGQHVEEALAGVPVEERCPGHPSARSQAPRTR